MSHLFVCKDKRHSIPELILRQHPHQLLRASFTRSVIAVDHKYQPWEAEHGLHRDHRSTPLPHRKEKHPPYTLQISAPSSVSHPRSCSRARAESLITKNNGHPLLTPNQPVLDPWAIHMAPTLGVLEVVSPEAESCPGHPHPKL